MASQTSLFENFCVLSQKVQKIQKTTAEEKVTPKRRAKMHKELEGLQKQAVTLQETAKQAQSGVQELFRQVEQMESQLISLYRIVEERFEEYEISLIKLDAEDLSNLIGSGKTEKVAKLVHELRHNVNFLFKHRRPSMQNRQVIHIALKLSDHAEEAMQVNGKCNPEHLKMVQVLRHLLHEVHVNEISSDPELAMELYEIADLLYHKKVQEGRVRLDLIRSRLCPTHLKRLEEAAGDPKELVAILLEIANGDPLLDLRIRFDL